MGLAYYAKRVGDTQQYPWKGMNPIILPPAMGK